MDDRLMPSLAGPVQPCQIHLPDVALQLFGAACLAMMMKAQAQPAHNEVVGGPMSATHSTASLSGMPPGQP